MNRPIAEKIFLSFLLTIFWGHLLIFAATSKQKQDRIESLQHEASVTLKLIQVYVYDKKGLPILDLSKEDFLLSDNGIQVDVTDFEIHRIRPVIEEKAQSAPLISRKFYLILDTYRNDGLGLKKARKTTLNFMDTQIQPQDKVGLLSYHIGRGLVLHNPLTTDHEKIRQAVNTIKLFPSITIGGSQETVMEEAIDFTDSMKEFAISLRYIPGYKHIILFSAGLPQSLVYAQESRLRLEFEEMAKELASSSSPIFTIDTQGLRDLAGGREQYGDYALKRLSDLTGGQFFHNVDYSDSISQDIQNSTGNYYVLGYSVNETWDGKYHEIKVKVERKGARVQAQKGYYNPKVFSKFNKLEKRFHLLDLAKNTSPQFNLVKTLPSYSTIWPDPKSSHILNLFELIPSEIEDILGEKAEIFSLIFDEKGVLLGEGKQDIDITENPHTRICVYTILPGLQGTYDLIFILRNIKTGKAAKSISRIVFPEIIKNPSRLSGPLLFIPIIGSISLQMETKFIEETAKTNNLSLVSVIPQTKEPLSPLITQLDKNTLSFFGVFGWVKGAEDEQLPEFTAQIKSTTTDEVISMEIVKRNDISTEQKNTIVVELKRPFVQPGEYVLEISSSGINLKQERLYTQTIIIR
ncbi:VWA domain-containing protein [Acidobacteriota bacterium]